VRILHTSDWHLLKPIGHRDRADEHAAVIDEVVGIAGDEGADLVVHSGDLFDRALPGPDAIGLALEGLVRLADGGRRPVVVVAGNHDSPKLFNALAPVLRPLGVHLVGDLLPPESGGAITLSAGGAEALVACVPFVTQGRVVDFMDDPGKTYARYADRMQAIIRPHHVHAETRKAEAVTVLAAHFMVGGVRVRGGSGPTGMKELTIGEAYAVTEAAVNHDFSYVALGHIHLPQDLPNRAITGAYAGSLLQLDFGEAGEEKRVVLVDAEPGRPAEMTSVPLTSGIPLLRASGRWEALDADGGLDEAWLDLTVVTDGPPLPAEVESWRARFPRAVKLSVEYPRADVEEHHRVEGRPIEDLYAEYHESVHGEVDDDYLALVREVADEATG
jgi:exonuclease SbcD